MASTDNYWTRARSSSFGRRRFLAGSATAAFGSAAILAGCGDDDAKKTATASASSAATGAATGAASAPAAGKRGGTFRVVKAVPDTGVDPAITNTYVTHTALTTRKVPPRLPAAGTLAAPVAAPVAALLADAVAVFLVSSSPQPARMAAEPNAAVAEPARKRRRVKLELRARVQ